MAQYNLEKVGRSSRRVAIKKGGMKFHPWAFALSFLIAFFVWLYLDGQAIRQELAEAETGDGEAVAALVDHADDLTAFEERAV